MVLMVLNISKSDPKKGNMNLGVGSSVDGEYFGRRNLSFIVEILLKIRLDG